MSTASTAPSTIERPDIDEKTSLDRPWIVIVWNDPINLMSYVTFVFQKLFGYSLEKTADATELDEAELSAWMAALNQVRLVLGTSLDVSEETELDVDPENPLAFSYAVYGFLGYLQEEVVTALAGW